MSRQTIPIVTGLAALVLACSALAGTSAADESFYRGKVCRILVGAEAGASYDIYSRLISRGTSAGISRDGPALSSRT